VRQIVEPKWTSKMGGGHDEATFTVGERCTWPRRFGYGFTYKWRANLKIINLAPRIIGDCRFPVGYAYAVALWFFWQCFMLFALNY
jgi:hypothetical protein